MSSTGLAGRSNAAGSPGLVVRVVGRPSTATTASPTRAATPGAVSGERARGSEDSPGTMRRIRQAPFANARSAPEQALPRGGVAAAGGGAMT